VLEYCAKSELRRRSGLKMLVRWNTDFLKWPGKNDGFPGPLRSIATQIDPATIFCSKAFCSGGDAKPQGLIVALTSGPWEIRASDGSLLELGSYSNNVNKFCCITTVNRQSWLGRPRKRGSLPDSRFALAEPN
jgi:hypothetical protein